MGDIYYRRHLRTGTGGRGRIWLSIGEEEIKGNELTLEVHSG